MIWPVAECHLSGSPVVAATANAHPGLTRRQAKLAPATTLYGAGDFDTASDSCSQYSSSHWLSHLLSRPRLTEVVRPSVRAPIGGETHLPMSKILSESSSIVKGEIRASASVKRHIKRRHVSHSPD